jgi:hypothetical protein
MVWLLGIFSLGPLFFFIEPTVTHGWTTGRRLSFVLVLPFTGFVLALAVGLANGMRLRSLGLTCPACGAPMVKVRYDKRIDTSVLLSGGRCVKCKRPLVEDRATAGALVATDLSTGRPPPTNPADFIEARNRLERGTRVEHALSICVVVGLTAAAWLATQTLLARGAGLLAVTSPWVASLGAIFAVLFTLGSRWESRARALGLVCAHCGALLVGGPANATARAVLALGTCPRCGTALWSHSAVPRS